jgi:hypothetical protein
MIGSADPLGHTARCRRGSTDSLRGIAGRREADGGWPRRASLTPSDAFGQRLFHGVDKEVDLVERGVDVGSDADAFELCMLGGRGDDPVLVPEVAEELARMIPDDEYVG